jgi:hypothetical protein
MQQQHKKSYKKFLLDAVFRELVEVFEIRI